ncbi:MAG: thioredoxin family protein [Candidatus Bathyarchaeota archaeon]|jgi:glutaredoxin-like protein|nr:glutaredoxin [Candidatus Bathyarchaeota archaeon A05DMB-5]MDH7557695.1 thioredoxin family protein [Candidatus Bathyarchaeota archaeon]
MSLIPDEHKEHLKEELNEKLENPVRIVMFTQAVECQFCSQTRQLITEVAALNDKIKVEIYDFVADAEKAKQYGVDKVPALIVMGEKDYGVRFYGLPFGYELATLLEAIINVSRRKTDLSEETKNKLKEVKVPVHIQVFVTLTCPYCPIVASIAHKFAIESDLVRADVVDSGEFPHLAQKYAVMGVPKTVINEKVDFMGPVTEDLFAQQVLLAAGQMPEYIR